MPLVHINVFLSINSNQVFQCFVVPSFTCYLCITDIHIYVSEYGLGAKASTRGDVYSFGILLLEMFTAKRPTDEIFKEGLSLSKFVSAMDENEVLKVADRSLIVDYEYSTQSSITGDQSSGIGSNTHWIRKAEECIAGVIRVGLCCTAQEPKDRWSMREAITKLQAIKHSMLAL